MRIPKLSAPLVKDIRTGEGILEWVLAALGVAAGATGDLSISKTGTYLTILAVAKGARRLLLKVVAAQKAVGIGAPLTPTWFGSTTANYALAVTPANTVTTAATEDTAALASINAAQVAAAQVQARPGTPAEQVSAGLAPSDPPAPAPSDPPPAEPPVAA